MNLQTNPAWVEAAEMHISASDQSLKLNVRYLIARVGGHIYAFNLGTSLIS